jgi:hypothetical protein
MDELPSPYNIINGAFYYTADQLRSYADEAVKQERELCALECERVYGSDERGAKACAVLIRARSQEGQG